MSRYEHKLDNPVWYSLQETHQEFALTFGDLKCYQPDVCPFGGFKGDNNISDGIDQYSKLIDNFYIVGERSQFSSNLSLKKELVCLQMVIDHPIGLDILEDIVSLDNHGEALFDLVNLVQPGYFKRRTALLGNYAGLSQDFSHELFLFRLNIKLRSPYQLFQYQGNVA